MRPLVVDFGRWPAVGTVVNLATVLDDPGRPAATPWPARPDHAGQPRQCRKCHRRVVKGELRDGLGPKCWARLNGQRRRSGRLVRAPHPRPADHDGPDLLDLLLEGRPATHPGLTT